MLKVNFLFPSADVNHRELEFLLNSVIYIENKSTKTTASRWEKVSTII